MRNLVSRLAGLPVVSMLASRDHPLGIDLAGHDGVRLDHLQLAPLAPQDLAAIAGTDSAVPDDRPAAT